MRPLKRPFNQAHAARWAVALSHDNRLVAIGGNRNTLYLASSTTGELVWDLTREGHAGFIQQVLFTSNDKYLISIASDMMVRVWDLEKKTPHAVYRFSSTNPNLNLWKNPLYKERAKTVHDIDGTYYSLGLCALSPDGKFLAIGGSTEGKIPFLELSHYIW